ncbi:unnamed protein product [Blepharisma stoltei]|uniref:Uncharacterized protein n=1 Tax=Blepharisma stoltei TaxID=1481888 RepID=A0AAU9IE78_9CILI|nr:unnamed protein product [Blepharisma stoltei]
MFQRHAINNEYTIDIQKWSVEYSDLTSQVDSIKALYPAFFVENNDLIMNLDLFREQNVVYVLLYSAVMLQWPSLNPTVLFSVDDINEGTVFDTFAINRMKFNFGMLSNCECINFLTNQNIDNEIKTLTRTLALYFYIRAQRGSITLDLDLLEGREYKWNKCKVFQKNGGLEAFLRIFITQAFARKYIKKLYVLTMKVILKSSLQKSLNMW